MSSHASAGRGRGWLWICGIGPLLAAAGAGFALPAHVEAHQEQTTQAVLEGVVVEEDRGTPIGEALVVLVDRGSTLTGPDGTFRFAEVETGRSLSLRVQAFGYQVRSLELTVRSDTTLTIELSPAPIAVDSLRVMAENVRIRGEVLARPTAEPIYHARAGLAPEYPPERVDFGEFDFRDIPRERPVELTVEAVEYRPFRLAFAARDTLLAVRLEPDSVAIRMIAHQVERLHERSRGANVARRRVIAREELGWVGDWNMHDVLQDRGGLGGCLFIDEEKQLHTRGLFDLNAAEVAHVEILDDMTRVYTKRYVLGLTGRAELISILEQDRDMLRGCGE